MSRDSSKGTSQRLSILEEPCEGAVAGQLLEEGVEEIEDEEDMFRPGPVNVHPSRISVSRSGSGGNVKFGGEGMGEQQAKSVLPQFPAARSEMIPYQS